jgi:hypothetical protein
MKLGLIPNPYVEPEPVSLNQVSAHGDYIRRVLEGNLDGSVSPSQFIANQGNNKRQRKAENGKKGKGGNK